MVEGRSVMEQLHELQLHVCDLNQYDCLLPNSFQANVILAQLPPSWRDFVIAQRHIKECTMINELSGVINVEERAKASSDEKSHVQAHQVEVKNFKSNGKKIKNRSQNKPRTQPMKKKKKVIFTFYVCGKEGHKASKCHDHKGKGPSPDQHKSKAEANVAIASPISDGATWVALS